MKQPFTDAHLTAIVTAAMPPRNEAEFDERSDTDFAHEIAGLARFRANVLKDRNGPPPSSAPSRPKR
jgi:twitching motility protein PilT